MGAQQIQEERGVGRIVFSPAGVEGLPVARQRLGVDRIEHHELVLQQGVHDRALALFQGNPDRAATEPPPQLRHPGVQRVGPLFELAVFHSAAGGRLNRERVPLIAPVQPDVRRQLLVGLHAPSFRGTRTWPWSSASPIVES